MEDLETPYEDLQELSRQAGQLPPLVSEIVKVTIVDGEVIVQVGSFNVFFAKATGELRVDFSSKPKE